MFEHFLSSSGLSVERLHALLLLKEHGTLIRAAGGDPNKQTRLSHYLRELSGFMGTPLTKREGRSIQLTAAGEELVELVRSQFQSLLEFQSRSAGAVRQVRIGAGDSLLQWLLIPSVGTLRSMGVKQRVALENLRTADLARCIQEQRLDFAIIRENAVTAEMASTSLGIVRHVIVVPRKFAKRRMDLRAALLDFPHVTVGGDGELVQKLRALASEFKGTFQPELLCSSIGQCIAALKSGAYAAVLPTQAWEQIAGLDCEVVSEGLGGLDRAVVLAWSPRNIEAFGSSLDRFRIELTDALIEEAHRIGLGTDA